jgi:hypothetical protein
MYWATALRKKSSMGVTPKTSIKSNKNGEG